jgi:hypothetical protein
MLIAYADDGSIIATQDYRTVHDEAGNAVGLVDYAAHEEAGGEMTDIWVVEQHEGTDPATRVTTPAKGSKVWPEWITNAHEFKVELEGKPGKKRIAALVHKKSGHRRERSIIDGNVAGRIAAYHPDPADIRDLVGGPDRPLELDEHGRTKPRGKPERLNVPLVGVKPEATGGGE